MFTDLFFHLCDFTVYREKINEQTNQDKGQDGNDDEEFSVFHLSDIGMLRDCYIERSGIELCAIHRDPGNG
jgi:hypothetical protein